MQDPISKISQQVSLGRIERLVKDGWSKPDISNLLNIPIEKLNELITKAGIRVPNLK